MRIDFFSELLKIGNRNLDMPDMTKREIKSLADHVVRSAL
jgi:hypothetical protein